MQFYYDYYSKDLDMLYREPNDGMISLRRNRKDRVISEAKAYGHHLWNQN